MKKLWLLPVVIAAAGSIACSFLEPPDDGQDGMDGKDGMDGAFWFAGTGAPADTLGEDGDLYLDTEAGDLFLKTAGTWSADPILNLTGEPGLDGSAGAVWLFGDGLPGAEGADGDFYLDSSTGDVYLKTAGIWSAVPILNLRGSDGATWIVQAGTPSGAEGALGDLYLDTASSRIYRKDGASAWTYIADLVAPASGADGTTGTILKPATLANPAVSYRLNGVDYTGGGTYPSDQILDVTAAFALALAAGDTVRWYLDGDLYQSGTGAIPPLSLSDLEMGRHFLFLTITSTGSTYSGTTTNFVIESASGGL
ncbi:MAG: hypothetical protein A2Z99_10510 [Treponema sp. GWB1_62_6]|nr:MAG: hypothetical protein A2Y36_14225 [Treponema sp. GWA1_62_8]OHE66082.1 MAG: hypothetical protein A2001_20185 [Treponema sp. GWC1_61_84]OHE72502.1 MAG: hypothetical protein A2Z99_10510 [Treponema sp. GWB1_62_6]HCM25641.1 hypothetical protein [Treponema sp.]